MENKLNIAKPVKQSNTRTNLLMIGLFFLVWAINGFFIGGNTLKLGLLGIGFILVISTVFTLPKGIRFVRFAFITFIILLTYWIIALLEDHNTTKGTTIIFDIICYLLLLSGFIIGRNLKHFRRVDKNVIIFIVVLSIMGVFMYIKYQSVLQVQSGGGNSRAVVEEGSESGINVIGLAYTNAIIFFILYYFLIYYKLNKWFKAMVALSMLCTFFLIFSTQSRGALIYIGLILFVHNLYRFRSVKNIFKLTFSLVGIILAASALYFLAIRSFPTLATKMEGTLQRFDLFSKFGDDAKADQSSYERRLVIQKFYDNLKDIIFFGQHKYSPYPHNQFIEIISRWGIFFGMPLIMFSLRNFYMSVRMVVRGVSINPFASMMVLLLTFSFLQSLSSMSLEMNRVLWLGFGFVAGLPKLKKARVYKTLVT